MRSTLFLLLFLGLSCFLWTALRYAFFETAAVTAAPQTAVAGESSDKGEAAPFNPIEKNGEYFVGWPKPRLALVFTGFQEGYLEPCGCAGMLEMKGGLSRRMSFLQSLREMNWPVIAIDGGDLCNEKGGKQAELKFHHTIEAFRQMDYDVVGLGNNDFRFSEDEVLAVTVNIPDVKNIFTSANVSPFEFNPSFVAPYQVVERNGVRIGVVSILTNPLIQRLGTASYAKADPVEKLKEIIPQLDKEKCEYLVLISHGTRGNVIPETREILKSFPDKFSIVLVNDPPAEPPRFRPKVIDQRYYIEVGEKGKFAVVLGIFDGENTPPRYQSVALDSRYNNSPVITKMMHSYQEHLKDLGPKGLNLRAFKHPKADLMGGYIGSRECRDCHEIAYDIWRKTRHANAWHSLTHTSNPPRNYDPDCVGCHVVGWNPQEMYPHITGFDISEKGQETTRHLTNVGCESCHGPGENHKKAEMGSNEAEQLKYRAATRLPLKNAQKTCIGCHDGDNSPNFDFESYWKKVEHREIDE